MLTRSLTTFISAVCVATLFFFGTGLLNVSLAQKQTAKIDFDFSRSTKILQNLVGTCTGTADYWYPFTGNRGIVELEMTTTRSYQSFRTVVKELTHNRTLQSNFASVHADEGSEKVWLPYGATGAGQRYSFTGGDGKPFRLRAEYLGQYRGGNYQATVTFVCENQTATNVE